MSRQVSHLQMIHAVIARLSSHSFLLKGWSVTLVAGAFALASSSANVDFIYLAYMPAVVFWGLDGYFLMLERGFRELYDATRETAEANVDFAMKVRAGTGGFGPWANAVFSVSLLAFHGVLLLSILVVMCLLLLRGA